jgi:spermidine synthase
VTISEERGVRSLHIGGLAIQSAMRLSAPDELELHYTRAMMSFLLFLPDPLDALMIGLGGGSMAKFIHRNLPATRITVVEIRNEVVAASRAFFGLPPEDGRLVLVVDDGARYVPDHAQCADVLLVDGFEDGRQPAALCSQSFYDSAYEALRPGGVLVVNFMAGDSKLDALTARVERSFGGRTLWAEAADRVNLILLAFRGGPERVAWAKLRTRAQSLKGALGLPADRFVDSLKRRNPHTSRYLMIGGEPEGRE